MVKAVVKDPLFLAGKSELATEDDKQIIQHELDHVAGIVI